jgi:hypothetical protein
MHICIHIYIYEFMTDGYNYDVRFIRIYDD